MRQASGGSGSVHAVVRRDSSSSSPQVRFLTVMLRVILSCGVREISVGWLLMGQKQVQSERSSEFLFTLTTKKRISLFPLLQDNHFLPLILY